MTEQREDYLAGREFGFEQRAVRAEARVRELQEALEPLWKEMPSGLTYLAELRKFAESLPDDLGPMFGRDIVRLLDGLEPLLVPANKETAE